MEPVTKRERRDVPESDADAVIREIHDDARSLSDRYLDETVVPEGGE